MCCPALRSEFGHHLPVWSGPQPQQLVAAQDITDSTRRPCRPARQRGTAQRRVATPVVVVVVVVRVTDGEVAMEFEVCVGVLNALTEPSCAQTPLLCH